MTYDDEVWDAVDDALDKFDFWNRDSVVRAAIEAIPPLTLKTEDGRFVKVKPCMTHLDGHWKHEGDLQTWVDDPPTRFQIVEEP